LAAFVRWWEGDDRSARERDLVVCHGHCQGRVHEKSHGFGKMTDWTTSVMRPKAFRYRTFHPVVVVAVVL
jgi:hypothetical protein